MPHLPLLQEKINNEEKDLHIGFGVDVGIGSAGATDVL